MRLIAVAHKLDGADGVKGFSGGNAYVGVAQSANEIADGAIHSHRKNLAGNLSGERGHLASDIVDVLLKLQNDVQCLIDHLRVECLCMQQD